MLHIYGIWYCLVQELTRLGMESCPFDPCVLVLREDSYVPDNDQPRPAGIGPATGPITGVLGIHVDDGHMRRKPKNFSM